MEDQGIYEPLRWMFEKARRDGLWFFSSYQRMWFSPSELERHQRNGRFRWGPVNWVLKNPQERILELMLERTKSMREIASIHQRRETERD